MLIPFFEAIKFHISHCSEGFGLMDSDNVFTVIVVVFVAVIIALVVILRDLVLIYQKNYIYRIQLFIFTTSFALDPRGRQSNVKALRRRFCVTFP